MALAAKMRLQRPIAELRRQRGTPGAARELIDMRASDLPPHARAGWPSTGGRGPWWTPTARWSSTTTTGRRLAENGL